MTTVLSSLGAIDTSTEAEEVGPHEVGPLMILAKGAVERIAENETSNWISQSVVSLSSRCLSIGSGEESELEECEIREKDIREDPIHLPDRPWVCSTW